MYRSDATFVEACLVGTATADEIDDYVDRWHDGHGPGTLPETLGMTDEEYNMWVMRPETLDAILLAHRDRIKLTEALRTLNL